MSEASSKVPPHTAPDGPVPVERPGNASVTGAAGVAGDVVRPASSVTGGPAPSIGRLAFLRAFLRHPRSIGSIAPSSRFLARAVAAAIEQGAPAMATGCVAELGPGTGSITRELLARLRPGMKLIALEIDPAFCAGLRRDLPDARLHVVEAPAQQLPAIAAGLGLPVLAVVSGLPFANFPTAMRHEIVGAAHSALVQGGAFAGYGYAPFALPPVLKAHFGHYTTGLVWRNLPPAFLFTAIKQL